MAYCFNILSEIYKLYCLFNFSKYWQISSSWAEYYVLHEIRKDLTSLLILNMLFNSWLALSLILDFHIFIHAHITLSNDCHKSIQIPLYIPIFKLEIIRIVAWCSPWSCLTLATFRKSSVKINESNLKRIPNIENNIFWFKITMHEPHTMQLSQPSENLKQYISELAGLAVLLEVHPEIHLVPLQHKECGLIWEFHSDQRNYMFALFILSLVQNLIFKVELLSEHIVLLESVVLVCSYKAVS